VKTGVQVFPKPLERLDSGFRRNDGKGAFSTFYESINIDPFPLNIANKESTTELLVAGFV
jgi:hypothetical protein